MITTPRKHGPRARSASWRLDPYAIEDCTLTLQEWRALRDPQPERHSSARRPRRRTHKA